MISRRFLILFLLLTLSILLLPTLLRRASAQQDNSSSTETSSGLRIVTLTTPRGDVKVYLPEVIVAGDTISGTVTTEPKGKDEKEKKENADRLQNYRIKINDETSKISDGKLRYGIDKEAARLELALENEKGKQLAQAFLALVRLAELSTTNPYFPPLAQSGRPYPIGGSFDGNAENTTVKIRDVNGKVIAESPRSVVVEIPKTALGPSNIVVDDNGNSTTGNFRALKIDLTAPKTSLTKGESMELHVEVNGLEGITQPVQVRVQNESPSSINITGGNTQNIIIQPSQVTSGGTFNWSTNVTGVGAGGFNITGSLPPIVPLPTSSPTTSKPTATPTPTPTPPPVTKATQTKAAAVPNPSPARTSPQIFPTPTDEQRFNNSYTKADTDCCKKLLDENGAVEIHDENGNSMKLFRNKLTMKIDGQEYEWEFTQDGKPLYIEWMFCHLNDNMIISQLTQVMIQRVKGGNASEVGSTTSVSLHGPYRDEKSRRPSYAFLFGSQKIGNGTQEYNVAFSMDAETCAWSCQLIAEGKVREFRTNPARSPNTIFNSLNQSVGIPTGPAAYQQQAWWNAMYSYFFEIEDWYLWTYNTDSEGTNLAYNVWRTKLVNALGEMEKTASPDDKQLIDDMLDLLKNTKPNPEDIMQIGKKFDDLHLRYGTKVPPEIRRQILSHP